MLRMNTTRNTRTAPQQYEEALAALGFITKVAKNISARSRSAAEMYRGQGISTLLDEWKHQKSGSGSLHPQGPLLDQFHAVTPGAIALRRLRHLRQVVGWIRKL